MFTRDVFREIINIGGLNFGEFMVIRQIRQCFSLPKFPSIRYIKPEILPTIDNHFILEIGKWN